jgi:hypothetical protein
VSCAESVPTHKDNTAAAINCLGLMNYLLLLFCFWVNHLVARPKHATHKFHLYLCTRHATARFQRITREVAGATAQFLLEVAGRAQLLRDCPFEPDRNRERGILKD